MTGLMVALTFVTVTGLVWGALDSAQAGRRHLLRRLGRHAVRPWLLRRDDPPTATAQAATPSARLDPVVRAVRGVHVLRPLIERVGRELGRANILLRPEEFVAITGLMAAGCGGGLWLLFRDPAAIVVGCAGGTIAPVVFVTQTKARRQQMIERQIPDLLSVLVNALRAGHGLLQALALACEEIPAPLGREFDQVLNEVRLGVPVEVALERLSERVGLDDLDLVITAVLIQRRAGGNLAEIFDRIGHTCKERIRIRFNLRTVTAQGRMSAWIISLLPVVFTALLGVVDPTMFRALTGDALGHLLLVGGVLMEVVGALVIRRIVSVRI